MYRDLVLSTEGRLATLTLNRPDKRNAFSTHLMRELLACALELEAREDVDVVVVSGAGGCFSAGADLNDAERWASDAPLATQREIASLGYRMARAWESLPQVTIAAIERFAIGGGLAFAVALDWRVLAQDAFVSLPEISLGIPLTWGTLPRLVNLAGPARAKRLSILCERMAATQALEIGLVDELAEPGKASAAARALAEQALAQPRLAVRMTKESVNAYASLGAHAASYMAHDQLQLAAASGESRAAREVALKRRKR